jgi:hypothetical protein
MFFGADTTAAIMTSEQVFNALMHRMQASSARINTALHVAPSQSHQ